MPIFDFDSKVQEIFLKKYAGWTSALPDWRSWLGISSREDYESLMLKLSGLHEEKDLLEKLETEKTESRQISIDMRTFFKIRRSTTPFTICHTSGTSGGGVSSLK